VVLLRGLTSLQAGGSSRVAGEGGSAADSSSRVAGEDGSAAGVGSDALGVGDGIFQMTRCFLRFLYFCWKR
jgi:hypothetical protein